MQSAESNLTSEIESLFEKFEEETSKLKDAIETEELVLKLLENIANNPSEQKYRRVKTNNPKIAQVIFDRWKGARAFFKLAHFTEDNEFLVLAESDTFSGILPSISFLRERIKLNYEIYSETDEGILEKQQKDREMQKNMLKQQQEREAQKLATLESIIHINGQADFQQRVLNSSKPVIVDFYADWCPPCKKLAAVFDTEIENSNGWVLAKVKSDNPANQSVSQSHAIKGIPAVFLYHKGKMLAEFSFTGFNPAALQKMILKAHQLA